MRIKKYIKYSFLFLLFLFFSCSESQKLVDSDKDNLTLGTFNLEWLGDGIEDNKPRTSADIKQIADIIISSGVEVMAVQEVENEVALARLVSELQGFKFKVVRSGGAQRVGILYKNYIDVEEVGIYTPLSLDDITRCGYIVNVTKNNYKLLMLLVHLKSTSRYDSTDELRAEARAMRLSQATIISRWADSVIYRCGIKELAIVGDFNDYPTRKHNATLGPIVNNTSLSFLSGGLRSCKNPYWFSIDHIVVSSETEKRYVPNSLFMYDFNAMLKEKEAERISDHCPVSVQLKIN